MTTFFKDPGESLDYTVKWDDVLLEGETILTSDWNIPSPLTSSAPGIDTPFTSIFIGGGVIGSFYEVINTITTDMAHTYAQAFTILCPPQQQSSGVAIFNVTRDDIIKMALEDIKAYAPDFQDPTPGAIDRASMRLNAMIKAWQAAGVGLWLNTLYNISLVKDQAKYYLGPLGSWAIPRPLAVVEARIAYSNGNEIPMTVMARDDYMRLPNKASTGLPVQYFVDPQMDNLDFYIWPVADADDTYQINMTLRTPIQDFQVTDNYPNFPVEWVDALHYNLAMRLIPVYDVPAKIAADVKELAGITLRDADGFDREQSVAVQLAPNLESY